MRDHHGHDARRRRLLWRCTHRGMKEMDLILGGFVKANIARFTEADLDEVEALSQLPDAELLNWITGRQEVPANYDTTLMGELRRFRYAPGDYTRLPQA